MAINYYNADPDIEWGNHDGLRDECDVCEDPVCECNKDCPYKYVPISRPIDEN